VGVLRAERIAERQRIFLDPRLANTVRVLTQEQKVLLMETYARWALQLANVLSRSPSYCCPGEALEYCSGVRAN
jgi:hypothetical protein